MKLLDAIGHDAKGIFKFLASPKGQTVIHDAEVVVEVADPALTDFINVGNAWMAEIIKTQVIATAAGPDVSDSDRAAMTINAMAPTVLAFITANKWPVPTPDKMKLINDAFVLAMNVLENK